MKKKLCGSLLLLAMLLGLLNLPAWAEETGSTSVLASGKCGFSETDEPTNDVTWTLSRSGLLTVRGSGAMYDYASADSLPWYGYRNQITSAEIQSGVTTVGSNAFRTCENLASVKLPAGLTRIGDVAFYHCDALAAIAIPDSVTTIGKNAFGYCALEKVTIPKSVVGSGNVVGIGEGAFFKCSKLTEITVDAENTRYSSENGVLFDKIEKKEDTDPDKSELICYPAAKSGAKYEIPEGIKKIGPYAFHSALKPEEVVVPDGLVEIDKWAFAYNSVLKNLTLPNTLVAVRDYAFYDCTGLSDDKGNEIEGATVTFKGSRQQWWALEMSPNGNKHLTNAKIIFEDMKQDNVVASGECGAYGSNASWSLKKLDDKGEQHELVISGSGAMSDYRSEASVPWTHYESAEEGAEPQDLREKITSVRIEGNLTNIGSYAFYNCDNLTTLTAETPSQLKTIGAYAFSDCEKLANMNLSQTPLVSIGDYAFSDNAALEAVELPETLETIGKRAFMRSGLASVTVPASVSEIGDWAFRWCDKLASFTMEEPEEDADIRPDASIGAYALADCAALGRVSFSENLMSLGDYALSNCPKLTGADIPSGVSGIGSCAFYNCPAMTGVNVDEANQSYCSVNGMLLNKEQTCIFYYPMGRTSDACAISELVTSVTPFAFYGATKLTDVYYGGSQSQWDKVVKPNLVDTYNDPLLNATVHAEGPDPADFSNATTIDSFTVEETEEGRTALVSVHCGENALGAEALCATYDKDGRFLGIESKELLPGTDEEISFALPAKADSLRLFVLDGNKSPCCPSEKWPESDAA